MSPTSPTIRPAGTDDHAAIHRLTSHAFAADLAATPDPEAPRVDDDRRLVAEAEGRLVGHVGAWPLGHWLAGARVPTGGVCAVAVDPAWRGRGVGRRLLHEALEAMAGRGEALATLFPLTRGVYRSLGWEVAGERPVWRIGTDALAGLPTPAGVDLRPGGAADVESMAALEARLAPRAHGMLARPAVFARRALAPGEGDAVYLAHRDGALSGYVVYRHAAASAPGELFTLRVRELVAADGASEQALWWLLGGHASGARAVEAPGPPAHPLELALPERSLAAAAGWWRWMTRVVDAPAAVAARGWPADVDATVELAIADPHRPANDGAWRLVVGGGQGRLERGGRGLVRLDVGALAPLLTGWVSPSALAHAGRLSAPDTASLAPLERALAGPPPWVRDFF